MLISGNDNIKSQKNKKDSLSKPIPNYHNNQNKDPEVQERDSVHSLGSSEWPPIQKN